MVAGAAALTQLVAGAAWACPSCKAAIEGDPLALSFYWSTLFMIAMPYLLVAAVGGGLYLAYRSAARQAAARTEFIEITSWPVAGHEKEGGR
jgi:hypothetical protein